MNKTVSAVQVLPDGYREIYSVDLQKDRKVALLVNLLAFVIAALLIVPACFIVPISTLFDTAEGMTGYLVKSLSLIVLMILYMVLHELVHGIAMKLCGTQTVKYGFTGMYAFAGSSDYYGKRAYIFIALAPVVLWGIVLTFICAVVPAEWFWLVYLIQVINLSGAAGDLFVTVRFLRFPKDILVRDHGVGMSVYSAEQQSH